MAKTLFCSSYLVSRCLEKQVSDVCHEAWHPQLMGTMPNLARQSEIHDRAPAYRLHADFRIC